MTSSKKLSQNAIGRALGLSSAGVAKLKAQGMPVDSVEAAQAWRESMQNIARRKPLPEGAPVPASEDEDPESDEWGESFKAARTRLMVADANLAELKEAELAGQLVRLSDVERFTYEAFRAVRDGMTNCSRRLGATVAVLATPDECAEAIDREHRVLLQSFAKAMRAADLVAAVP